MLRNIQDTWAGKLFTQQIPAFKIHLIKRILKRFNNFSRNKNTEMRCVVYKTVTFYSGYIAVT